VVINKVGGQSYPDFGVTLAGMVILYVANLSSTLGCFGQLEIKKNSIIQLYYHQMNIF